MFPSGRETRVIPKRLQKQRYFLNFIPSELAIIMHI